jgi:hypothetical protein
MPGPILKLHVVEVIVPWGGICENDDGDRIDTLENERREVFTKFEKNIKMLTTYLIDFHRGKRI